ncbi:MAG: GIY-YIG nuclease family protein [Nanoarchaeota archaeon]
MVKEIIIEAIRIPIREIITFFIIFLIVYSFSRVFFHFHKPKLRQEYPFYTYIIECTKSLFGNNPFYYVGSTQNFYKRFNEHKLKQVKPTAEYKYIRAHYVEGHMTRVYAEEAEQKYKNYPPTWLEKRGNLNYNLLKKGFKSLF